MPLTESVPLSFSEGARRMVLALQEPDDVVVCAHVHPDGDAAGSLACAAHILAALGKRFFLYSATGLPRYIDFFPMPARVYQCLAEAPFRPQSALILDCSETGRLDSEMAELVPGLPSVNIDHHLGSEGIGSLGNWVDPAAAATAQLMAYVAMSLGLRLSGNLALSIALGLITDTGGFCHGNTTADVFSLCAQLASGGCRIPELREMLNNRLTIGCMHLRGKLMQRVRLEYRGKVAFCAVRMSDFKECGCWREDLEGFVEQMRRLRNTLVSALLREENEEICKFSLRSHGNTDVQAIAASLGGGGHRNAAGGTLAMPLEMAEKTLLAAIGSGLSAQGRNDESF